MRIILIRHGESLGNVDVDVYARLGDPQIPLTDTGWQQAAGAGRFLRDWLRDHPGAQDGWPRLWVSPFLRTKQTARGVLTGLGDDMFSGEPPLREDVRLVEQSFGYLAHALAERGFLRRTFARAIVRASEMVHGKSPYIAQTPYGESPLMVHARMDGFVATLHRDMARSGNHDGDVVIVAHGGVIKNFLMRWFHLPLSGWDQLRTPGNCDVMVIDRGPDGRWGVTRIYDGQAGKAASNDPLANVARLSRDNLPPLPPGLK